MIWDFRKSKQYLQGGFAEYPHVGLDVLHAERYTAQLIGNLARGAQHFTSVGRAMYSLITTLSRPIQFVFPDPAWQTFNLRSLVGNILPHASQSNTGGAFVLPELTGSISNEDHVYSNSLDDIQPPEERGDDEEQNLRERQHVLEDGLDSDFANDEFGPTDNRCLIAGDDVDLHSIFLFDARGVVSIDDLVVLVQEKVDAKEYFRSYTPRDAKAIQQLNENTNAIIKPIEKRPRPCVGHLNQHRFTVPCPYDIQKLTQKNHTRRFGSFR